MSGTVETGGEDRDATTACARCGELFVCGVEAGQETCWCFAEPVLPATGPAAEALARASGGNDRDCLCPKCLRGLAAENSPGEKAG